jgi:hypothetical protein
MASLDALQALTDHPEWIPPRSDARVFLGEPGAPEATKTTVEPGNAFSPGMRTFGVTWWLRFPAANVFFAPELAPLEDLHWRFEDGYLPLLHCETQVRDISIRHSLFQDGSAADQSEAVCARLRLVNDGRQSVEAQLFLALRSLGPAGGPLRDLRVDATGRGFRLARRDLLLLGVDRAPDAIGCGIGDPSPAARAGSAPIAQRVEDPAGWCFGLMRFDLALRPGEIWQLHCPQQTYGTIEDDLPGTARVAAERYDERSLAHLATWRNRLTTISLETPDAAFREAFFAGLLHMLIATVGDQARIAPLAYPLPWLRDSIYIIRALDLAGLHAIARGAVAHCARNDFFGGFGAEGDAPGQGIWAIVQHYRLTGDRVWLRSVYPDLRRKCDWLFRMRRAERPIQVFVDTPVFAFTQAERASGVICLAARAGIIRGTMDHGVAYSVGWINQWALRGLGDAAFAARELGHAADAEAYEGEYKALYVALRAFAERTPEYFSYERTVNSLLWPTRAWEQDPQWVDPRFDAWWGEHRGDGAAYTPEPYWLYFEFAQAHNALRSTTGSAIRTRLDSTAGAKGRRTSITRTPAWPAASPSLAYCAAASP